LIIGIATASRLYLDSAAELIVSAVLAGLGIALIQAVMPALIKSRYADNVSLFMGLYVTSIMGGAALAASFSPFVLAQTGSWRIGLAIWALLALVALGCWYAQRSAVTPLPLAPAQQQESFFSNSRAWLLAIFFGLGTASYTCVLAWLAPYYVEKGWSEQHAGLLLGFLTAMEVLSGLVTPAIANRSQDKRVVLAVLLVLIMGGFCGLILSPERFSVVALPAGPGHRRPVPDEPDRVPRPLGQPATGRWPDRVRARHRLPDRRALAIDCRDDPRSVGQLRMGLVVAHCRHGVDAPDGAALQSQAVRAAYQLVDEDRPLAPGAAFDAAPVLTVDP